VVGGGSLRRSLSKIPLNRNRIPESEKWGGSRPTPGPNMGGNWKRSHQGELTKLVQGRKKGYDYLLVERRLKPNSLEQNEGGEITKALTGPYKKTIPHEDNSGKTKPGPFKGSPQHYTLLSHRLRRGGQSHHLSQNNNKREI